MAGKRRRGGQISAQRSGCRLRGINDGRNGSARTRKIVPSRSNVPAVPDALWMNDTPDETCFA
jgi:hypothetical protein